MIKQLRRRFSSQHPRWAFPNPRNSSSGPQDTRTHEAHRDAEVKRNLGILLLETCSHGVRDQASPQRSFCFPSPGNKGMCHSTCHRQILKKKKLVQVSLGKPTLKSCYPHWGWFCAPGLLLSHCWCGLVADTGYLLFMNGNTHAPVLIESLVTH